LSTANRSVLWWSPLLLAGCLIGRLGIDESSGASGAGGKAPGTSGTSAAGTNANGDAGGSAGSEGGMPGSSSDGGAAHAPGSAGEPGGQDPTSAGAGGVAGDAGSGSGGMAGTGGGGTSSGGPAGGGGSGGATPGCVGVPTWMSQTYNRGARVTSTCNGPFVGNCVVGQTHEFECNPAAVGGAALIWCMQREPGVTNGWSEAWVDKGLCQ